MVSECPHTSYSLHIIPKSSLPVSHSLHPCLWTRSHSVFMSPYFSTSHGAPSYLPREKVTRHLFTVNLEREKSACATGSSPSRSSPLTTGASPAAESARTPPAKSQWSPFKNPELWLPKEGSCRVGGSDRAGGPLIAMPAKIAIFIFWLYSDRTCIFPCCSRSPGAYQRQQGA